MQMVGDRLMSNKNKKALKAGERGYYPQLLRGMAVGDTVDISKADVDIISKAMSQLKKTHQYRYKRKQVKELGVPTGAVCITRLL